MKAEKKNGGISITWEQPASEMMVVSRYEVVLADVDKNVYVREVNSNDKSVVFYGLPMNEYYAASVKAFSGSESKYSILNQSYYS